MVAGKYVLLSWGFHVLVLVLPAVHPRISVCCILSAHSAGYSAPGHAELRGNFLNTELSLLRTPLCVVIQ